MRQLSVALDANGRLQCVVSCDEPAALLAFEIDVDTGVATHVTKQERDQRVCAVTVERHRVDRDRHLLVAAADCLHRLTIESGELKSERRPLSAPKALVDDVNLAIDELPDPRKKAKAGNLDLYQE